MRPIFSFLLGLLIVLATFFLCSAAFAMTSEPVAPLPGADDALGWWTWTRTQLENGAIKLALAGFVTLAVWGVRAAAATIKDPAHWFARFAANRWGALALAAFMAIGTAYTENEIAGRPLGRPLLRAVLDVFVGAVIAWVVAKKKLEALAPVKPAVA